MLYHTLGQEQIVGILRRLAFGPQRIDLNEAGEIFLAYDQVTSSRNHPLVVGYVYNNLGKPVSHIVHQVRLDDLTSCKPVAVLSSDRWYELVNGRSIGMATLAMHCLNSRPSSGMSAATLAGETVESAANAGLLPVHSLPETLLTVPRHWFGRDDLLYEAYMEQLVRLTPRDRSELLGLATQALLHLFR